MDLKSLAYYILANFAVLVIMNITFYVLTAKFLVSSTFVIFSITILVGLIPLFPLVRRERQFDALLIKKIEEKSKEEEKIEEKSKEEEKIEEKSKEEEKIEEMMLIREFSKRIEEIGNELKRKINEKKKEEMVEEIEEERRKILEYE